MKHISQFFSDGDGQLSATRLMFIFATTAIVSASLFVAVRTVTIMHFDTGAVALVGTLMAGKVAQSFSENSTPAQPPAPPT